MSLKYVPPNAPSLITAIGVLFAPKSIYKISLHLLQTCGLNLYLTSLKYQQ